MEEELKVYGGGGNDTIDLRQASGNNTVNGGDGDGWIFMSNASGNNSIDGSDGTDTLAIGGYWSESALGFNYLSFVASNPIVNIEKFSITGSDFNDTIDLSGSSSTNYINDSKGDDILIGGSGNEYFYLFNSLDNNTANGGAGDDFITLHGSSGDNVVHGNMGNDYLIGGYGRDTFRDGFGADYISIYSIYNWSNFDSLREHGADNIYLSNDDTPDTIYLIDNYKAAATIEGFKTGSFSNNGDRIRIELSDASYTIDVVQIGSDAVINVVTPLETQLLATVKNVDAVMLEQYNIDII